MTMATILCITVFKAFLIVRVPIKRLKPGVINHTNRVHKIEILYHSYSYLPLPLKHHNECFLKAKLGKVMLHRMSL